METIWNTTKNEHERQLNEMFQDALHFECAVAFAKMSGFKGIKKRLEASLKKGMSARFIVGLDFYLTDPDVLETLLKWKSRSNYELELYVSTAQPNVCFHPKIYSFRYNKNTIALTGSANLTGGGFGGNWECSLLIRQQKDNEISRHLQGMINEKEVIELTDDDLAEYRAKHRLARAIRSATERQITRLVKSGEQTLEPLKAMVRELKLDHSSSGLDSMSQARARSASDARAIIASLRQKRPQSGAHLLPYIGPLRDCFHSGGLQRHISMITRQSKKFLQLLDLTVMANDLGDSPQKAYDKLRPLMNDIRGLGPNWASEILHALAPSKYAILNQNSVAGMELAGIKFPPKPNKVMVSGALYGEFCVHALTLVKDLELQNLSELDLVFNHAYWNYEGDDD
jgi:HKD family nuclease